MGKRSSFERNPRDYYKTPYESVLPLLAHLPRGAHYIEPCAGDGALINHLKRHGHHCVYACDIEPQADGIEDNDILFFSEPLTPACRLVITNTPWEREVLHAMIERFRQWNCRAWLLLDADYMHTIQAAPYLIYCSKIVSVGRVKWIPDSDSTGVDNACWYCFEPFIPTITQFVGRI